MTSLHSVRVMASQDNSNRVRLQVWVSVDLADRLVVAAQEQDRSVSREAARRLEASFGSVLSKRGPGEDAQASASSGSVPPRSVSTAPRVPPEPPPAAMTAHPDPHPYTTPLPEPLREAVAASKGAVTVGAKVGTCPREHYHRSGRYCSACGQTAK